MYVIERREINHNQSISDMISHIDGEDTKAFTDEKIVNLAEAFRCNAIAVQHSRELSTVYYATRRVEFTRI